MAALDISRRVRRRVIPALFGQGYDASIPPFRIYLMMMPLRIALYGAIAIALGKPRIVLLSAAGALLLNAVLNVILVTRVGLAGPAIATVVSSYVHVGILLGVVMAQTHAGIAGLVPFRGLFEIGVTAGIAALTAYAATVAVMTGGDLETVAITLAIFTGLYLSLERAGFIRFIRPGDILKGNYGGREG